MTHLHLPRVVGIHGHARVGKDSIATYLVEHHGYVRYSLADPIRDALYTLNPLVSADNTGRTFRLAEVVDDLGWDEAKAACGGEIRALMQRFGTEVAREQWDDEFWIDRAKSFVTDQWPDKVVISDIRFANELCLIDEVKYAYAYDGSAYALKVERPGFAPINDHASDAGLPNDLFDGVISNDGTIAELHRMALFLISRGESI